MSKIHPYLPNSVPEIKEKIMKEVGIESIDELYLDIPEELRFKRELEIPGPHSEVEVRKKISNTLEKNFRLICPPFLGGGVWPHYVPVVVDEVIRRAEFLTSYTPYQPEISQGILQAIFEYQSLICELVGMEVANSSMYDWSTALGEAARMAYRLTRRNTVHVPDIINPNRYSVMKTYTDPASIKVMKIAHDEITGQLDVEDLKEQISKDTAAIYIENPSYLGFLEEEVEDISEIVHDNKSIFIVGVDPISLGLIKPPGEYNADIVIGEGQPLGNHMNYGGPLLGIMATTSEAKMIRQMPGRLIGITESEDGTKRGLTMTLQTREQHIRREKATSNICSNQALCAVASATYLSLLGPQGIRELSEVVASNTRYAMRKLNEVSNLNTPLFKSFHFKEFTIEFQRKTVSDINSHLLANRIQGGKSLVNEFPEFGETALYCVTEQHTKKDIDKLVSILKEEMED